MRRPSQLLLLHGHLRRIGILGCDLCSSQEFVGGLLGAVGGCWGLVLAAEFFHGGGGGGGDAVADEDFFEGEE